MKTMKTWNQLFVRHGWGLAHVKGNVFDCADETEANLTFLFDSLDEAGVLYTIDGTFLELLQLPIDEARLLEVLDCRGRGRTEMIGPYHAERELELRLLDTHIAGIVRQLNRLEFETTDSCDGHGRRSAHIGVTLDTSIDQVTELFIALGLQRVYHRKTGFHFKVSLPLSQAELLDLAESLSLVQSDWLEKGYEYIQEQLFLHQLEELLSVSGASGNESAIRSLVCEKLTPYVDRVMTDRHGNLLAERTYKSGNGPTIMLNAHLDTYAEFAAGREILKDDGIWQSSEGILGADDRAGIAVILQMAKGLRHSSFNGKVKFVFTVGEERGLVGASLLDEYFLWDVDAAFVIDRRGSGDIVTSCGGYENFCDEAFGACLEKIAADTTSAEWKCTAGGSSDTRVWASHGIQSVNLSVGYRSEHTSGETLDVKACYGTVELLKGIFSNMRELRRVLNRSRNLRRIG